MRRLFSELALQNLLCLLDGSKLNLSILSYDANVARSDSAAAFLLI
jgi:hypothetical protein